MKTNKLTTLQSKIDAILFAKDTYVVLKLGSGQICVGNHALGDIKKFLNEDVVVKGRWVENKKLSSWQLEIENIEVVGSDTIYFFLTKVVTGIGPKLAKHMIDSLGGAQNIEDMIENRPNELVHIEGVGKTTAKKIRSSWFKHVGLRRISEIMLPLGFTINQVNKVYQHYYEKIDVIAKNIRQNIYVLSEVPSLGFSTIDEIALRSGLVEINSLHRVASAISHTLRELGSSLGHSSVSREVLYPALDKLLIKQAPNANNRACFNYDGVITRLIRAKKVVDLGGGDLCSTLLYRAESFLFDFFNKRNHQNTFPILSDEKLDVFIRGLQSQFGKEFDVSQINAIKGINRKNIMALVGYAGTGKSTICKGVLELLSCYYSRESIFVCALSGIATDNIKELSGFDGATIQSILVKADAGGGFDHKVLVIDEASMVDSMTLYKLLKLVEDDTRVILVGDVGQLPPLAAGAPFIDVVENNLVPVHELKKIYRQSDESVIALHANVIRKGEVPDFNKRHNDFCFRPFNIQANGPISKDVMANKRIQNNQRICEHIKKAFTNKKVFLDECFDKRDFKTFLYSHQVISPMKKGVLGIDNINQSLQQVLNPTGTGIEFNRFGQIITFKLRDKVLHIKNCDMDTMSLAAFDKDPYVDVDEEDKKRIFNGYFGAIVKVDEQSKVLWVYYCSDNVVVRYQESDIKGMLMLGYSCTIHKSQGSSFGSVLLPMTSSQFSMHNSRLLYTAITRARKMCYVVGETRSFVNACRTHSALNRKTVIQALI